MNTLSFEKFDDATQELLHSVHQAVMASILSNGSASHAAELRSAVHDALVDLASTGQRDREALQRYAAYKVRFRQ